MPIRTDFVKKSKTAGSKSGQIWVFFWNSQVKSPDINFHPRFSQVTLRTHIHHGVPVQVFQPLYGRQFRSVPAATAIFQTHQYLLLSSFHFLTLLDYNLKDSLQQRGSILELSPMDLDRFCTLQNANKQAEAAASSIQAVKKAR
jgi:hypothetical protein